MSLSRSITSGFHGIKVSLTGFLDVSEDQERMGIAAVERVSTTLDMGGTGGINVSRARVIAFNQSATRCSSEPATGIKVPSTLSFCEVPAIRLCTVSVLTPRLVVLDE